MFCHKCGAQVADGAAFCHKCGTKIVSAGAAQQSMDTLQSIVGQKDLSAETMGPVVDAPEYSPDTMTNEGNFKEFVDKHIQTTTKFQSAEELLDSHVPQKFLWLCFGIPAVIGFIAGGPLAALLFALFFGYSAALLTDFMKGSRAAGSIEKISSKINSDELLLFLNQHLNYLSPHFHEWGYINYGGFGVRGAVMAHTLNSITASTIKIGTGFGRKQRCFVVIWIEPDEVNPGSGQTKYYFRTAMRSIVPSKYLCMVKTVPILQATMEYYLNHYNN